MRFSNLGLEMPRDTALERHYIDYLEAEMKQIGVDWLMTWMIVVPTLYVVCRALAPRLLGEPFKILVKKTEITATGPFSKRSVHLTLNQKLNSQAEYHKTIAVHHLVELILGLCMSPFAGA